MIGVSVRMSVCPYVGMCTKFFFGNHNLEVDSVSQTFLPGCSFTFRITSIADHFSDTFFALQFCSFF